MNGSIGICAAVFAGGVFFDALARRGPIPSRYSAIGLWLLACGTMAIFGFSLAICGNEWVAAGITLGLHALFALASNAKRATLGEPLLFSDLALVGAIFRHPQFYLTAIPAWQRVAVVLVALALLGVLVWFFEVDPVAHAVGLALLVASLAVLAVSLRVAGVERLAPVPDAEADVARHGLLATLLLYWLRWRESVDPPACPPTERHPGCDPVDLVVIVQCESFADPRELFGDGAPALPGLEAARNVASQRGRLNVSGFGAYTMRTEYGVLFGREESELGFRRYDPFLTAMGEVSYALPARLANAGRTSCFLHPHDMRFYGRDRIMPAAGFAELVGEARFAPPVAGEGRYVTDAAMTEEIVELANEAAGPSMIYAVTIENHGPWAPDGVGGEALGVDALVSGYLRLAGKGDVMLSSLMERLAKSGRSALLVFFGDHRPSIPGASAPGGDRHTPYVMIRIDRHGNIDSGNRQEVDLTPAGLHHAILDAVLGEPLAKA